LTCDSLGTTGGIDWTRDSLGTTEGIDLTCDSLGTTGGIDLTRDSLGTTGGIDWTTNSMDQSLLQKQIFDLPPTQEIPLLYLQLEDSVPCSEDPDTGPKPNESSPHPHILLFSVQF
jgi:hypothetical protein